MATGTRTVEISVHVYEMACRGAALDQIDVARYLEGIVMRDAEYIRTREFLEAPPAAIRLDGLDAKARLAA